MKCSYKRAWLILMGSDAPLPPPDGFQRAPDGVGWEVPANANAVRTYDIGAMDNGGTMHVFRASKAFVSVADSALGEESVATPAFAGDTMFIRGKENFYCVGAKQP